MKTFTQFQEDAYKPPKSVDKVAKQMEKDGVKFPDAEKIDDIIKFDEFLENNENHILIAHCSPRPTKLLVDYKPNFKKICLLIGCNQETFI